MHVRAVIALPRTANSSKWKIDGTLLLDTFEALLLRSSRTMRKSKTYLLLLAFLAVVYLFYRFRSSITRGGFRWEIVLESLHHARLSFILLSIAIIYAGFALRALRW